MLEEYENVLVTGGCGFIGSHLVDTLVSLGKQVVVLDNLSSGSKIARGIRLVRGDLRDPGMVKEAVGGADPVFHTAANANGTVSVNDPRFDFENNVVGTFNVLEAVLQAGVKRLVQVSSFSVYGVPRAFPIDEDHPTEPFVPYGGDKLAGEVLAKTLFRTFAVPVVIGRPVAVYGPGENPELALVEVSRYLRWHLNGRPIRIIGDVDRKTRDFVHVTDLVQGLMVLADRGRAGESYNIGSGGEISMRQLAETIGAVTAREAVIEADTAITEDTYRLVADIAKIKALGYVPKVSLTEGLRQLVEEMGERPTLPSGATIFKQGQRAQG